MFFGSSMSFIVTTLLSIVFLSFWVSSPCQNHFNSFPNSVSLLNRCLLWRMMIPVRILSKNWCEFLKCKSSWSLPLMSCLGSPPNMMQHPPYTLLWSLYWCNLASKFVSSYSVMKDISLMMRIRTPLHSIRWTSDTLAVSIPEALTIVHPPNADAANPVHAV